MTKHEWQSFVVSAVLSGFFQRGSCALTTAHATAPYRLCRNELKIQARAKRPQVLFGLRHSDFLRHSSFVLRHSYEHEQEREHENRQRTPAGSGRSSPLAGSPSCS